MVGGVRLIDGKVVDVERRTTGGFARGTRDWSRAAGADAGRLLRLEIQNENLVALEDGGVLASVPDLITARGRHDRRRRSPPSSCATASGSP